MAYTFGAAFHVHRSRTLRMAYTFGAAVHAHISFVVVWTDFGHGAEEPSYQSALAAYWYCYAVVLLMWLPSLEHDVAVVDSGPAPR